MNRARPSFRCVTRPAPGRPSAAVRRRRGESGAALLMAFMVLLVLLVVTAEVAFKSQIEISHTMAFVDGTRFRYVAEAAIRDVEATLLMDIDRDEGLGADSTGDGGGDEEGSEDPFGAGGGDDGEGGAADGGDVTATTDSKLDEWMHSESLIPVVGGGFTMLVEVVDEDRKVNLLGLWAEDEEERDRHKEVAKRLLDKAFEGTSNDFGAIDGANLIDRLEDWVKGNRGNSSAIPVPKLKQSLAEETAEEDEAADATLFEEERNFPLTLNELSMLEGVDPVHLWGFVEDDHYYPGLMDLLTIWSHLELKPEPEEEDAFAESPFGALGDAENAEDEDEEDELLADPTNDGLVNLNTAPLVVLRALAPDEIPTSYLEKIVEFRLKIDELEEEEASGASLLGGFGDASGFEGGEEGEDEQAEEDDGEKDITDYVFEDPANLWDMIEDEFDVTPGFDSDIQDDFTRLFSTRSQVFTIKVLVYDEMTGRRQSFRKVVWRMQTPDGPLIVPLRPIEPYWDPRRLVDYEIGMDDMKELKEEKLQELQYRR